MDRHPHRLLLALAAATLWPRVAFACPVCFNGVESPILDSARIGVLAMAGLTVCVLTAFGAWFLRLARLQETDGIAQARTTDLSSNVTSSRLGMRTRSYGRVMTVACPPGGGVERTTDTVASRESPAAASTEMQ